ncbi:muramoyltetrapeptide carboxypeptidase [Paraburkholderia caballeronis]|uniref:Murein tetrapeptidase LD-carboxypeptidase Serine peptidase. MEROPS family S66 n=1 Tax=Paraburkholderia caballeronis TaxID=416943 RepID=A0A1H7IVJ4_9BURK|nr:muramoyltetrapeptide carboxypeptidase [Paraburkholderia caballeronis]PXW27679.1 murein tetrapeptidase LD-carboxypeptidase [Paraburkholderia caballeronis]PXX03153.1 murein tetrapeptidase LD-carboxypeptidase [Paraburkholderia caballeronis]RAK03878.1 murein tetrapeptidase LD-carboxypeptidase [Paraburkholderia caballeronis]TDV20942.1 murein tetrapeptidase LD-carboxypeptidase [Paraburkholderia caballeronis]TDV21371.1 murein tetrapeptidase LD-carboxypeptidase [Paraburkholderia caballeronis]
MSAHRTIELIAPSGYPHDPAAIHRALERLHAQGHRVEGVDATERRYLRFAGTDGQRAAELNRLADASRPLPDIVLAVRGGYGAVRLLHGLDYDGLQNRLRGQPVAFVGHSDFTAIQLALLARSGLTTFGGPMLASDFGADEVSHFTMRHFWNALTTPTFTLKVNAPQPQPVSASGMLWGGNLAVLTSLVGTPYMPPVQGGILFVEDVNEQPFRVERMIYQLHLSGILAQQQALVLGDFSGGKAFDYDNGYDLQAMVEQVRSVVGIPVLTGLPFGHIADMVTLPVGASAKLEADRHGFELTVSDYPHLG